MSTFRIVKLKCGVCKHTFADRIVTSTSTFDSPDLDLRPSMLKRATMPMWIRKCPNCGYVHTDIAANGKPHKAFINSTEYKLCEGNRLASRLAADFYRYALILQREKDPHSAYDAFLHAAWASDDAKDREGANVCRNKAIALFDAEMSGDPNLALRHLDLLRRAGRFAEVLQFCDRLRFEDSLLTGVLEFQRKLSQAGDTGCYRIEDCATSS